MRISIIQASIDGTPICVETFNPTTNGFGLVNLMIGSQNTTDFATIDWFAGPYFVKIEIDLADEGNYTEMGTTQLLSVHYALHAKTAEGIDTGSANTTQLLTVRDQLLPVMQQV
jgi:hypothetical protein